MTTQQNRPVAAVAWWRRPGVIWGAVVAGALLLVMTVFLMTRPGGPADGATDACQGAVADRLSVEPAAVTMYVSDSDAGSISGWVVVAGRPSVEGHDYTCYLDGAEVAGLSWDGTIVKP